MPSNQPLPNQEANLFKKILKCYELKQYRKSLQYVKDILKKFPDHGETLSMKGLILNYLNKKAEAYECAQRGLKNDMKSHVCWHVYGLLQRSDRKYDEAIKCYVNALKCDKENLQILRDLSLLQIQIRDLEGYRDTRYQLLHLRPTQRVSWIGYAMAFHLTQDYETASDIIEEFSQTQQPKTNDYEHSELTLYQNMVYREANMHEKALKHVTDNQKFILDKLAVEEIKADANLKLGRKDKASQIYEELIERNPDNVKYYKKMEECLYQTSLEQRIDFYNMYSDKYPRSDVPRKAPLEFIPASDDQFRAAIDKYMQRALHKGVPPLFKELKHLFKQDDAKFQIIESLMLSYVDNLLAEKSFTKGSTGEKEPPTSLLWTYYYLAQHYDHVRNTELALKYVDKAMEITPTLVEIYMVKAKIYKHAGNLYEAVKWMDEAQSLDTADRFINYKCSKYMLRANMIKEAQEICSKFTREGSQPFEYLKEMQCMWFETECANSYKRLGKYGESLKKCHQVERHFQEIIEDQFDFHSYCMRKMTLSSYVEMLRLEDRIKSHPFFFRAAKSAIEVYLRLQDKPLTNDEDDTNENTENLTPSELKKLRNKQKKQQLKAQQEKEKQQQLDQKKRELSKQKNKEDNGDDVPIAEDDLHPEKLEKPEKPLEECNKFLKPLEEFAAQHIETHMLAFEVYSRKDKFLLMLKFLKKMKSLDTTGAKFHFYLCKFLLKYTKARSSLNETIVKVVETETSSLFESGKMESVQELNDKFIKATPTDYSAIVEAAKVLYDLNPAENQSRAVKMVINLDEKQIKKSSLTLKKLTEVFGLLSESEYFGKLDEKLIDEFKTKAKCIWPHANLFQTQADLEKELLTCTQNLSLAAAIIQPNDLSAKLARTTLNGAEGATAAQ